MAHKKAGSSSKNGRDSVGQRLGVTAGVGAGLGHDYRVFATVDGKVRFEHATRDKKRIRVIPVEADPAPAEA